MTLENKVNSNSDQFKFVQLSSKSGWSLTIIEVLGPETFWFPNFLRTEIFLSNSNPTWNSTELELVRVGVDFVFQCHKKKNKKNKKNKKKNPHLILIYRKGLQVYNLGRVIIWGG